MENEIKEDLLQAYKKFIGEPNNQEVRDSIVEVTAAILAKKFAEIQELKENK